MKNCYRHGDVLIRQIDKLPDGVVEQSHLRLVEGEQTGHHHSIVEGAARHFRFNDKIYLEVLNSRAKIDHPEHGPGWIEPGVYEIDVRREWEEDGWVKIID